MATLKQQSRHQTVMELMHLVYAAFESCVFSWRALRTGGKRKLWYEYGAPPLESHPQ